MLESDVGSSNKFYEKVLTYSGNVCFGLDFDSDQGKNVKNGGHLSNVGQTFLPSISGFNTVFCEGIL